MDRVIRYVLAVCILCVIGCDKSPPPPMPPGVGPVEQQVIDLHNTTREDHRLEELHVDSRLMAAAADHAYWMAGNKKLSHTGRGGSSPFDRMLSAGYRFSFAGENIAAGYSSPESVMGGWMRSNGHRQNILNKNYREIGVALGIAQDGTHYWCVCLGQAAAIPAHSTMSAPPGLDINIDIADDG